VLWSRQMRITDTDKAWFRSMNKYVRNEDDQMPPVGRYNAGQKLLFWGFVVCGAILLLTGVILWFPEYIPWSLRSLRYIAVFFHASAALLTIGLFMIHIYMSVFAERGAIDSMVLGDVSEDFAKRYHPGWYEEVTGTPARTK
jgi:formate dehydrogenase subunit gamma